MSNIVIHKAETRGSADYGWLKPNYYFSFANYYHPERVHFGMLRVVNDDFVEGGMGFAKHPHDNMEIITIPLEGALIHKDSMGNSSVVHAGEIQVMSAGKTVIHSEHNFHKDLPLKLFQIWVFPNQRNVEPRYQQITLDKTLRKNKWQQVLSPNEDDEGVWIYQDAWFMMGDFDKGQKASYELKDAMHGVYLIVIEGDVNVNGNALSKRDAIGISEVDAIEIEALNDCELLLMEVPMR
ncbi:MAG: pirin family protein [Bacteroidota bacterium]|nr:pirin family protein [Bacteroidota bacterium]